MRKRSKPDIAVRLRATGDPLALEAAEAIEGLRRELARRDDPDTPALWPMYHYKGRMQRAKDGDTLEVLINLGIKTFSLQPLRLAGYNAPEKRGPNRSRALEALAFLERECRDQELYVKTFKDQQNFERYPADAKVERGGKLVRVDSIMRAAGFDVPQGD